MKPTILFLDTEFTGLHQATTLISLAIISDSGKTFYAEFSDFDTNQINPWVQENVIPKLEFSNETNFTEMSEGMIKIKADSKRIKKSLEIWLRQFEFCEIWADVLAYDWVLFCNLFGGAMNIPSNIFYAPFDLATLFRIKGITEPESKFQLDVSRFDFVELNKNQQHNSLQDVMAEKLCYEKLMAL